MQSEKKPQGLLDRFFALLIKGNIPRRKFEPGMRQGVQCPKCGKGTMEIDGCLNLVCQNCGFVSAGCGT